MPQGGWRRFLGGDADGAAELHQADADLLLGRSGEGPPGIELVARPAFGWGTFTLDPHLAVDGRLRRAWWGTSRHGVTPGEHHVELSAPPGYSYGQVVASG